MISIKDSVYLPPVFEKTAGFKLSKNVSDWNEEILQKFIEEVPYLPKDFGMDVVVNNVDENEGYAKGSVVAWYQNKKINFPIIVKEFELSPFDVFTCEMDGKVTFLPANIDNVKKTLSSERIATLQNRWQPSQWGLDYKTPGGVPPKQSMNVYDLPDEFVFPPFSKMSNWHLLAKKEDLDKFAEKIEQLPSLSASFHDNTGDLVTNVIKLRDNQKEVIPDDHKMGIVDLNKVVDAKQAITVIDSQLIDPSKLTPVSPPSVYELRMIEYPSMEEFIESGQSMMTRFMASKIGSALPGIVLDYIDESAFNAYDGSCCASPIGANNSDKVLKEKRDQIFISLNGKYYSRFSDYNKTGVGFYGSKIMSAPNALEGAVKMISNHTTSEITNLNKDNNSDSSDKPFITIPDSQDTNRYGRYYGAMRDGSGGLFIIYGAGNAYECFGLPYTRFKKKMVNDSMVFVSDCTVIIPANINSIQKVSKVESPIYKMIVGKAKNIYLVPEGALFINAGLMCQKSVEDFIRPDLKVRDQYEHLQSEKTAVYVNKDCDGYRIEGTQFEPLKKVASLSDKVLTTKEALTSLVIMGMEKAAAEEVLKVAVNRYTNNEHDGKVEVFGLRNDYINPDVFQDNEKRASLRGMWKEFAYNIRKDLIKEASVLEDPDAVDVVLSLNFINEESLNGYIENIPEMKRITSKLAEILTASRMGLSDIDETAVKKTMEGLQQVIDDLENVKMSLVEKGKQ